MELVKKYESYGDVMYAYHLGDNEFVTVFENLLDKNPHNWYRYFFHYNGNLTYNVTKPTYMDNYNPDQILRHIDIVPCKISKNLPDRDIVRNWNKNKIRITKIQKILSRWN